MTNSISISVVSSNGLAALVVAAVVGLKKCLRRVVFKDVLLGVVAVVVVLLTVVGAVVVVVVVVSLISKYNLKREKTCIMFNRDELRKVSYLNTS